MKIPPAGAAHRPSSERRQRPRHRTHVPMRLGPPTGALGDAIVEDISLSGVRCLTPQVLPVMSMVGLQLVLAVPGVGERDVACQGVVVRTRLVGAHDDASDTDEPARRRTATAGRTRDRYETAIFFTSMSDKDRLFLGDFLRLAEDASDAFSD